MQAIRWAAALLVIVVLGGCSDPSQINFDVSRDGIEGREIPTRTPTPTYTPTPNATEIAADFLASMEDIAIIDLADRFDMEPDDFSVAHVEEISWPNASLGCPVFGISYPEGDYEGYIIWVAGPIFLVPYRADKTGEVQPFICYVDIPTNTPTPTYTPTPKP